MLPNFKTCDEKNPLISIVIPVYNGQKYLDRLLSSIRNQTLKNFEVLLIDDESSDSSHDILKQYAEDDSRFRLISKSNDGRSSATKVLSYGLAFVQGEYFYYASQDDIFSEDLLKSLYERAIETNADAVIPEEIVLGEDNVQLNRIGPPDDNYNLVLSGKEAFIKSLQWEVSGFALRKTNLVRQIGYDTSIVCGDDIATRKYYLQSNKVVFSKGIFYYFSGNPNAITRQLSWRLFDWTKAEIILMEILRNANLNKEIEKEYAKILSVNFNQRCRLYFNHRKTLAEDEEAVRVLMINSSSYVLKTSLDNREYLRLMKNFYWFLCMKAGVHFLWFNAS